MTVFVVIHFRMIIGVYDDRDAAHAAKDEWIKRYPSDNGQVHVQPMMLNKTWYPKGW